METNSRYMNNKWDYGSLHPIVPNPYTLLSEISKQAKYFSVIDFLLFKGWGP